MPPSGTPKEPTGAADPLTAPSADAPGPDAPPVGETPSASDGSASGETASAGPWPDGDTPGDARDDGDAPEGSAPVSRRHPRATLTTGTVRPEGGGRAAPGDASAPARQWPLLTVLGLAALGLLIVGTDLFPQAFRVGTLLVGAALLTGAVLRRTLPSVGMLAVRSRFTDMITYGVMGALIVLLALMVQPQPWLKIPFLEDVLHLTVT
ncbi:DUF3017 domain-containing protein [Streptomyces sp. NPDC046371]|uniref:DUF3017 domain-containing protein n=1 Tax=unclassified Streptomyces TaxID=2593676 RepID=UPI0033DF7EE8